jgi:hypothetical protein
MTMLEVVEQAGPDPVAVMLLHDRQIEWDAHIDQLSDLGSLDLVSRINDLPRFINKPSVMEGNPIEDIALNVGQLGMQFSEKPRVGEAFPGSARLVFFRYLAGGIGSPMLQDQILSADVMELGVIAHGRTDRDHLPELSLEIS